MNLGLLGLFAVQHSVMARPAFKRAWTRVIPAEPERSVYVLASSLAMIALFAYWQPLPDVAASPSSLDRAVFHARRAIGDTHRGARIQSVARRGDRLVGPLRNVSAEADRPFATPFVGRTDALATRRAALRVATRGAGRLLLGSRPPGIGKTRLLRACGEECERASVRCCSGHRRDREAASAY